MKVLLPAINTGAMSSPMYLHVPHPVCSLISCMHAFLRDWNPQQRSITHIMGPLTAVGMGVWLSFSSRLLSFLTYFLRAVAARGA